MPTSLKGRMRRGVGDLSHTSELEPRENEQEEQGDHERKLNRGRTAPILIQEVMAMCQQFHDGTMANLRVIESFC